MPISRRALLTSSFWVAFGLPTGCLAQLGTSVCVCSPATYEITFDFSRTCENTALRGDGIITSDCAVAPFQDDSVTDLVPVSVGSIDILELDANLVLLTQSSRFGTYKSGDYFPYESISRNPLALNTTSYPRALQVSVIGNNVAGESLFFAALIVFLTDCSIYPNMLEGSSIGWIRFTKLETPNKQICPASVPVTPTYDRPQLGSASHSGSGSTKEQRRPTKSPTHQPHAVPSPTKAPAPILPPSPPPHSSGEDCLRVPFVSKGKKKKSKSDKGKEEKHIRKGKRGKYYYYEYHSGCYESKSSDKRKKNSKSDKKKAKKGTFDLDQILQLLHHHSPTAPPIPPPISQPVKGSAVLDVVDTPNGDPSPAGDGPSGVATPATDLESANQRAGIPDSRGIFFGSAGYYCVLLLIVGVALTGVALLLYHPHRAEDLRRRQQYQVEQQMSIMKGIEQWSNSGQTWVEKR